MTTTQTWLDGLDPAAGAALAHVLDLGRALVPEAVDGMSYGLHALVLDGKALLGVGAGARHLSVVPYSPTALDTVRDALTGHDVTKGLVRFTPDHPIDDGVLTRLVLARFAEIRPGGPVGAADPRSVQQPGR